MIDQITNPLVSIIVPVYNVERYIGNCIKSLISQDYTNIEIILVDDGSTDNSGKIADEFSKKDRRIRVIHQKNSGVSCARNAGADTSTGMYIMFVDGDDWVETDYVSYFVRMVMSYGVSIGVGTDFFTWKRTSGDRAISTQLITSEKAVESIYNDTIFVTVWNKIYEAHLLKKVKFSADIWYGEGMLFNIECLQLVSYIAIGNKMVYHQTFNSESAMRNFSLESNYCGIASLWLQRAKWKKNNKQIEKEWFYHRYRFNRTILDGLVRTGDIHNNKSVYKECVRNIRRDIVLPLKHENSAKQKIIWLAYFICPMLISKMMAKRFIKISKKFGGGGYSPELYPSNEHISFLYWRCA